LKLYVVKVLFLADLMRLHKKVFHADLKEEGVNAWALRPMHPVR
jgi:hypothetical protein